LTPADVEFLAHHEITHGDSQRRVISITFDAGASSRPWPRIRDTLVKHRAKATIFLTGDFIKKNPDVVREMVRLGMELGNHSMTHPNFTELTDENIRNEIRSFQGVLDSVVGYHIPIRFFRFPFGARDKRTLRLIAEMGLQSVYWSPGGDSGGWREDIGEKAVLENLRRGLRQGQIYILHIGSMQDAAVLDSFLQDVELQEYSVGPVSMVIHPADDPPSIAAIRAQGAQGPFAFIRP